MALSVGTRLGPYEIVAAIGAGGMGEVYRARDPRLNRDVAIKVLTRAGHDAARQRRLTEEARAASALNHPNIVTVYDVGEQADVPFIVSELVDGKSLRTLLLRAPLSMRDVLDLAVQMADGLAAAHLAGIVHRDFKPDNVMVTREGRVKILDFGLALVGTQEDISDGESTMTQANLIVGTVPYMSPEQARGATVTFRTDQFSLGLTLYEMVTGKRTFQAETAAQVLAAILEREPEPIAKLNPRVPVPLRWVIERCLAKDARQRYDSTTDLARELRTLRDRLAELEPGSDVVPAAPRRRRLAVGVLLGGAVVFAALGALFALSGNDDAALEAYRFTPFAVDAGYQSSPAWSGDGKQIAYVATVDGVLQVFTRSIDSPRRNQVTTQPYDCYRPFWNEDGTRLYYIRMYQERLGLFSVSSFGGTDPEPVLPNVTRAALSPDGKTLALWRASDNDDAGVYTLWLSSAPFTSATQYTRGPFGSTRLVDGRLQFSPDGSKVGLLIVANVGGSGSEFWEVPLQGEPRLAGRENFLGGFSWLPDSRHILGAIGRSTTIGHLWMMDTETGRKRLVLPSARTESEPAVSPNGQPIAMSLPQTNYDVYRLSVDAPVLEPVLTSAKNEMDPTWSGALGKMAVTSDRSGREEIWLSSPTGELERPVVDLKGLEDDTSLVSARALSPNGQRLAYFRRKEHGSRIWIQPVAGGQGSPLISAEGTEQDMPSWSPNSEWIAYAQQSPGTAGTWSVNKVRVGGKTAAEVLVDDVMPNSTVQWAPNDAWIAFNGQDGLSLISPDRQKTKNVSRYTWFGFAWSEDSRHLFGIRASDDVKYLMFTSVDVGSGTERVLVNQLAPMPVAIEPVRGFSRMSGTTFLTSIGHISSDIWLLEGVNPYPDGVWTRLARRFQRSRR